MARAVAGAAGLDLWTSSSVGMDALITALSKQLPRTPFFDDAWRLRALHGSSL